MANKITFTRTGQIKLNKKQRIGVWAYHYSNPLETRCCATIFCNVPGLMVAQYRARTKGQLIQEFNDAYNGAVNE